MALVLPLMMVVGCATGPTQYQAIQLNSMELSEVASKPAAMQGYYRTLYSEGKRNLVLNQMRIGVEAMKRSYFRLAEDAFDIALTNIESVYANNAQAQKARSLWYEEGEKDYKGEPYERAMAYYYRGLLYLRVGDYGNARASFESGLMQDAFAEEDQNRADFAVLVFLSGWAASKMGSDHLANGAWQELKSLRPDFEPPSPNHDLLVVAETGQSPRKLADGIGHYELVYRRGKGFTDKRAWIDGAGGAQRIYPMEDVYWQASTRGGRPVDRIIKGQVKFKSVNESMGSALAEMGNTATVVNSGISGDLGNVGTAFAMVGVAQMALSARSRVRVDTRYWDNLPDAVHVMTMPASGVGEVVRVHFGQEYGQDNHLLATDARVSQDSNGNSLVWARSGAN